MSRTKPVHRIVPLCLTHHAVVNRSPCPDLLLCNEPPSTSQIDEVNEAIRRDEEDMSATDTAITRFQYMLDRLRTNAIRQDEADIFATNTAITRFQYILDRLRTRRTLLQESAKRHLAVMSTVRQLPAEILGEIFLHCWNPEAQFHPFLNTLWRIIQVSGRWRAIALGSSQFWRHFVFKAQTELHEDELVRAISLQLQWSNPAPLSIRIEKSRYNPAVLKALFTASTRWEDLSLQLFPAAYMHLFAHRGLFPALKRLGVSHFSDHRLPGTADFIACLPALAQFIKGLPALEELHLDPKHESLSTFTIRWHRLRKCTLMDCRTPDVLHILARLTTGTRVFISSTQFPSWSILDRDSSVVPTISSLCALVVNNSSKMSSAELFGAVTAPFLEELIVTGRPGKPNNRLGNHIFSFLNRSACPLTRLHITVPMTEDTLLRLLGSHHLRGVVDLNLLGSGPISAHSIDALSCSAFPCLCSLAFRSSAKVKETDVVSMLAKIIPVLRTLRLQFHKNHPVLSEISLKALRAGGLEVAISQWG